MKISLEKTREKETPYNIRIQIASLTVDLQKEFNVPVYLSGQNGHRLYDAEVCGFRVEAETPEETASLVEKLLPGLVNSARFPTYIFIARRSRRLYPVYTVGDEVQATTPGGPIFRHVELARVREYLTDYLHQIGKLGVPGQSEKLHVRGVSLRTLALIRPLFYLKKRATLPGEEEFWAPVLPSHISDTIYTYAASQRREVDIDNGHEILRIRNIAAQALMADKRLSDDLDLRADRLLPDYWQKVKKTLVLENSKLVVNHTMNCEIYRDGEFFVAVEYRSDEDRYSFYIGRSPEELRNRAAKDLVRRGLISNTEAVRLQ